MIRVGITGQNGFVGYHLYHTISLNREKFTLVNFERSYFENENELDSFVIQCDVLIHLAALNRHSDAGVIYETNIGLTKKLVSSLERTKSNAHVIMSSSTQEERDNLYGKSKKESRLLLARWANKTNGCFTGMIIPNVFGPFCYPFYNSVVSTFCHQVVNNETPKIESDAQLKMIYVGELVEEIIRLIHIKDNTHELNILHTSEIRVSQILSLIQYFKKVYQEKGEFPKLNTFFEKNLFNTYRSYINIPKYFPKELVQHNDARGSFVEIVRNDIAGQTSFSTTMPSITRGNHFHTRKIERFAVIKGEALIQLRKIGTNEVVNLHLSGNKPAYVDMPVWYTHNITNVGDDILYTIFWINEPYNVSDPDTWFEDVVRLL